MSLIYCGTLSKGASNFSSVILIEHNTASFLARDAAMSSASKVRCEPIQLHLQANPGVSRDDKVQGHRLAVIRAVASVFIRECLQLETTSLVFSLRNPSCRRGSELDICLLACELWTV